MCGFYTVSVRMWASTDAAWLYVTETECDEQSATPCRPSASPAFTPLSCLKQSACERQTGTPPGVPFCLILANTDAAAPLDLDLDVTGSLVPVSSGGGGGGGGGFGSAEIALICLGAGTGLFMVSGLLTLFTWLRRKRTGPRSTSRKRASAQVAPESQSQRETAVAAKELAAAPLHPVVTMTAVGSSWGAAPAPLGPMTAFGSVPPVLYGTLTLLPAPSPGTAGGPMYGGTGGMMMVTSPGGVQYEGPRSPPALAPLPAEAYGTIGRPSHSGDAAVPSPAQHM